MRASARSFVAVALSFVIGCGGARDSGADGDADPNGLTTRACTDGTECASGVCDGGFCAEADACSGDGDCASGTYCKYPSTPDPWVAGTDGRCELPCNGDSQCDFGQSCVDGQCYTNISCDPANNSQDCPPGEACSLSGNTCGAPPSSCVTDTQCPFGWRCNVDNTCVDPNAIGAGGCNTVSDCSTVAGCGSGLCECVNSVCRPAGSCANDGECQANEFCNGGECQTAQACAAQVECTPYGLVCQQGLCKSPQLCNNGTCSQMGYECNQAFDPPACFPAGGTCQQPSDCPAMTYCDVFSGTCQAGCNNNIECQGECNGALPCSCNATGQCVNQSIGTIGSACLSNLDCGGGQICAPGTAEFGPFCDAGLPLPGCEKACYQACDAIISEIVDSCPSGYSCGGDQGNLLTKALFLVISNFLNPNGGSVSACLPDSGTSP